MKTVPFLIHALSPLHAGTGQSADIVDLPIARMRATNMPFVPGSSIKGVLRAARQGGGSGLSESEVNGVFGPPPDAAHEHAGAVAVGDARLLLLPVRSFLGTFAYVTSPLLLQLAKRDLGVDFAVPAFAEPGGRFASGVIPRNVLQTQEATIVLEDLDIRGTRPCDDVERWAAFLAGALGEDDQARAAIHERFVVVDDETMSFLWDTCTQLDTRVRLDDKTRTVAKGALWVEESLPSETVLIGLLGAEHTRDGQLGWGPDEVLSKVLPGELFLQLGGKATVGRGRCRVLPLQEVAR